MAWNSSRTGVAIAAFWVIVCVSPSSPAQEWVRWRNTPSLLDQDPAKRLPQSPAPPAQPPQAREAARRVAPPVDTVATASPAPRDVAAAAAVTQMPTPAVASATLAMSPTTQVAPAALAITELALAAPAPVVPVASDPVPATASAPQRGAPAITLPAATDTVALEVVPLGADGLPTAASVARSESAPVSTAIAAPALAHVAAAPRAPRSGGAYVTVGSDSDASVVAAAPQVYSCDESGRCEHLQNELPSVGLQAAPGVDPAPDRPLESEIKRSALRRF